MFRPLWIITKVKDCTLSQATTAFPNLANLVYESLIILRLILYIYDVMDCQKRLFK